MMTLPHAPLQNELAMSASDCLIVPLAAWQTISEKHQQTISARHAVAFARNLVGIQLADGGASSEGLYKELIGLGLNRTQVAWLNPDRGGVARQGVTWLREKRTQAFVYVPRGKRNALRGPHGVDRWRDFNLSEDRERIEEITGAQAALRTEIEIYTFMQQTELYHWLCAQLWSGRGNLVSRKIKTILAAVRSQILRLDDIKRRILQLPVYAQYELVDWLCHVKTRCRSACR
jgi:hypothetical protein